ncbi:MAG: hypothetical protein E7015_00430 [Alphaproteobacteria bacterium]|nr:hypothetical protein [Alphaproteobacteria bacterium]
MKKSLFALLFVFCFASNCSCEYDSVDEISEKIVDSDLIRAKQKALDAAKARGFQELIVLRYPEAESVREKVNSNQIQRCIFDYSISNEKMAGNSYSAKFSFRFDKKRVNTLLAEYGIKISDSSESPLSDYSLIAIYRADYPACQDILTSFTVVKFSGKRIVLKINKSQKSVLLKHRIRFASVND